MKMVSKQTYFLFMSMVMFLSGMMLYLYVMLMGIDMFMLDPLSCPLFYLVAGFVFFMFSFFERVTKESEPEDE